MYACIHCKLCIYAYLVFVTSISIDQLNTSLWNTKPAIDHLINQYAHIWAGICICETSLHTYLTLPCETLNHRWCVIEQSICNRYPPHLPSHLINALFKHVVNNIETPPVAEYIWSDPDWPQVLCFKRKYPCWRLFGWCCTDGVTVLHLLCCLIVALKLFDNQPSNL